MIFNIFDLVVDISCCDSVLSEDLKVILIPTLLTPFLSIYSSKTSTSSTRISLKYTSFNRLPAEMDVASSIDISNEEDG